MGVSGIFENLTDDAPSRLGIGDQLRLDQGKNGALINEQKVDILTGVYSSAQCVPLAAKVDAAKKFLWMPVCVSSAVLKGKNLQYVFRPGGTGRISDALVLGAQVGVNF